MLLHYRLTIYFNSLSKVYFTVLTFFFCLGRRGDGRIFAEERIGNRHNVVRKKKQKGGWWWRESTRPKPDNMTNNQTSYYIWLQGLMFSCTWAALDELIKASEQSTHGWSGDDRHWTQQDPPVTHDSTRWWCSMTFNIRTTNPHPTVEEWPTSACQIPSPSLIAVRIN
jgi:hypothetical protein